jgi:hypothetical protein
VNARILPSLTFWGRVAGRGRKACSFRQYLANRSHALAGTKAMGPPVVSLDPNGTLHGLRNGTATIIGRYDAGGLLDNVCVEVAAE